MRVSHLFFADDLLLFAEATHEQAGCIKEGLDNFSRASGQKVSYNKSMMFVSPNIEAQVAAGLSTQLGIPLTEDLGRYLGYHLIRNRRNNSHRATLLEKVKGKLGGWKSTCLSRIGRLTLAKSVISSMAVFHMQCQRLSVKTHKDWTSL